MDEKSPPAFRPKTVSRSEKRELILAAARQVFAQRGVVEVTMEDIAKEARVSKGALYLHFASKDELYLHLTAQGGRELLSRVRAAQQAPTALLALKAMLQAYVDFSLEDPMRFRLEAAWIAPGYQIDYAIPQAEEYRAAIVEVMRVAVDTVLLGQREGSIRSDIDAVTLIYQSWGCLLGLLILRAKGARPEPKPPQADPEIWRSLQTDPPTTFAPEVAIPGFIEQVVSLMERRD